jgi:hypothetical protein
MIRVLYRLIYRSVSLCGILLLLSPVLHTQNITLSWPNAPVEQPKASSAPPPKSSATAHLSRPPIGGQPTDGSINGNTYTNNFFQFSLRFPEGWKDLGRDTKVTEKDGRKVAVLLTLGTIDRQTHGIRVISISTASIPSGLGSITAKDFLKRDANGFNLASSMKLQTNQFAMLPTGEPTEISIEGRRIARLDMTGKVNNIDERWMSLMMIDRGYGVLFMFLDPSGGESGGEAAQAIKSLHFLSKTN